MAGERFRGAMAALGDDQPLGVYAGLGAVIVMMIAGVCPWLTLPGPVSSTVNGVTVEGGSTILGLAALAAAPLLLYALRGEQRALLLTALAGGLGVVLAVSDAEKFHDSLVFGLAWGLWLYVAASAAVFGSAVWLFRTHGRR